MSFVLVEELEASPQWLYEMICFTWQVQYMT